MTNRASRAYSPLLYERRCSDHPLADEGWTLGGKGQEGDRVGVVGMRREVRGIAHRPIEMTRISMAAHLRTTRPTAL